MFIYSRAVFNKIIEDIKKFIFIFSLIMQTVYIGYLVYAIVIGAGILYVNITLLILAYTYAVFIVINQAKQKKISKNAQATVKKIYRRSKIFVNAFTLASTLYGVFIASSDAGTVAIILAAFTSIVWLLSVLLEILSYIFEKYAELITGAFEKDLYQFKKWLPGTDAPEIKDKTNRKIESLGTEYESTLDAKKILRKAEKKIKKQEKRHELRERITGRIKSILPKKKTKITTDKADNEKSKVTTADKK